MIILDSAHKHGILDKDIEHIFNNAINSIIIEEFPLKFMVFGFDTVGRALEIGYFVNEQGEDIIMHAMKIRRKYQKYLYI